MTAGMLCRVKSKKGFRFHIKKQRFSVASTMTTTVGQITQTPPFHLDLNYE